MENSCHDETHKQFDLFLSDEYDKVLGFMGAKITKLPLNDDNDQHHDLNKQIINHRIKIQSEHSKLKDQHKNRSESKIDEQDFDEGFLSSFVFDQSQSGSSDKLQIKSQSSQIQFESSSLPSSIKEKKDEDTKEKKNKKLKKSKKSKKIKRSRKINNEKKQKDQNQAEVKRKIRTTVSQEKIKILQHLFPYIQKKLAYKGTIINLKDVAKIVNLGYSTILHKYKDYRRKGNVQKGLLLKSKDVKRKYRKSLVIQNHIKSALKERKFSTAKQLAIFISQKHKLKVNRSIISRHLNGMKRQKKYQYLGGMIDDDERIEEEKLKSHIVRLQEFSRIFFGLKNQGMQFFYMTVIQFYLVGDRLIANPKSNQIQGQIVNLVITSTQNHLVNYYPTTPNDKNLILKRQASCKLQNTVHEALYEQLSQKIFQNEIQVQNCHDKVYIVFPYENNRKQFTYRQKVLKKLLDEKINVIVIPPRLNKAKVNFIHKWFFKQVFKKIENQSFQSLQACRQSLMKVMNQEQVTLFNYANQMITIIEKRQRQ